MKIPPLSGVFHKPSPKAHFDPDGIDATIAELRKRNIISKFRVQTILDEVGRVQQANVEHAAPVTEK